MLHCHTTIRGRKSLAVVIEGMEGVHLKIEYLFIRQTPTRLQLYANEIIVQTPNIVECKASSARQVPYGFHCLNKLHGSQSLE